MRVHLLVRGRVQGVGFRWFVRETAEHLRLGGWVRNRPDGSVEVAAEGPANAIDQLRAALADGPPGASVKSVDELDPPAEPFDATFTIRR